MSYQALYRVWRPQTFAEVSGQKIITQTIKNAIQNNNTSHAYLFTGPRGTGKTSAAKIFAKAINCPNQEKGEPCNQCDICRQITEGSLGDVIEIDAASNNGVEEIRDIRDKANYAPTQAEYKVYIIDEVHMLSMGAFNALLKTLEEPPTNVIFILATTEPHKIPLTIISRTQRFDFKRISSNDIIERMEHILEEVGVPYDQDALTVIANAAEGGMRDALSILDQSISFMDEKLSKEVSMEITGAITLDLLLDFILTVEKKNSEQALVIVQEILANGKSSSRFIEDLILLARDLLLAKVNQTKKGGFKLAQPTERLWEVAEKVQSKTLYEMIEVLNKTQQELRFSNHAEVYLEVATIKLTSPKPASQLKTEDSISKEATHTPAQENELEALKKELASLKKAVQAQNFSPNNSQISSKNKPQVNTRYQPFKVNLKAIYQVLEEATREHLDQLQSMWGNLNHILSDSQKGIMYNSTPVAAGPTGLVVTFEYDILCEKAENDDKLQEAIGNYIEKNLDYRPRLICVPAEKWPSIRKEYIKQMKDNKSNSLGQDNPPQEVGSEEETMNEEDQLVNEAYRVFGQHNVEVTEE